MESYVQTAQAWLCSHSYGLFSPFRCTICKLHQSFASVVKAILQSSQCCCKVCQTGRGAFLNYWTLFFCSGLHLDQVVGLPDLPVQPMLRNFLCATWEDICNLLNQTTSLWLNSCAVLFWVPFSASAGNQLSFPFQQKTWLQDDFRVAVEDASGGYPDCFQTWL